MSYRLRESIKGFCLLLIAISFGGGLLAWLGVDRPDATTWVLRWCAVSVGVLAFLGFLSVHFRKGTVPDYLGTFFGDYFDCQGFGFCISTRRQDDVCVFDVIFQNRHSNPCIARVVLRPTRRLFRKQDQSAITLEVSCPGGSFGYLSSPVPVADDVMGTLQKFDVIAGVDYPQGRGDTLHYGEGSVFLRSKVSFDAPFQTVLTSVALLGGTIVTFKHASISLHLPQAVKSDLGREPVASTEILWAIGDPLLEKSEVLSRFS